MQQQQQQHQQQQQPSTAPLTSSTSYGQTTNKYTATATSGISSIISHNNSNSNNLSGLSSLSLTSKAEPSSVTWAPTPDHQKSSEIDRIMAKIEQARLSIANVCVLIYKQL